MMSVSRVEIRQPFIRYLNSNLSITYSSVRFRLGRYFSVKSKRNRCLALEAGSETDTHSWN